MNYVYAVPDLTWVDNIIQSLQRKRYGLIWVHTVYSGLFLRLFTILSVFNLIWDDSVITV